MACRTTSDTAVILGENVVNVHNIYSEEFKFLSKIHVFPKYIRGVKEDLKNNPDVALLQLELPLIFGPKINAICLHTNPNSLYEEEPMISAGWGLTERNTISDELIEFHVKVFPKNICRKALCSNGESKSDKCFLKR